MPTSVVISFGQLTDPVVAFASVDAWNSYFSNITFNIASANLPLADLVNPGAVKMSDNEEATSASWTQQSYSNYYVPITFIDAGGAQVVVNAVTKEAFDLALVNIAQLKALYDSLIAALQLAGTMSDQ